MFWLEIQQGIIWTCIYISKNIDVPQFRHLNKYAECFRINALFIEYLKGIIFNYEASVVQNKRCSFMKWQCLKEASNTGKCSAS